MSAPTSPPTSPRNKSKLIDCKVLLLDDTIITYPIPVKSVGQDLYNKVVQKLEVLEADYFDIQYTDVQGVLNWLDHDKQILRQISRHSLDFRFVVKFYTPDPGLLEEEYTRYLFALQVKRDLSTGTMPCQEHTAVLLASYIVQAEFGDFMEGDENAILLYLRNTKLLPKQNDALERKILEHHREHSGQSPADAEFNLLDTARKVDLYGIQMHPAKDHETVPLHLAVAHMGILVFQNQTKINTFSWAKIRKLSFKRKKFLVKLHPDGYGYYKDTVEFYFESRNECKNFWKKCLEHHAFFRCHSVKRLPRNKTRVVSRGSSFRYSGRTQKQLIEHVRENFNKRPTFQRPSTSMRTVSMSHSAMATPKTGTLSSRDLHLGHHLSMSSGSRIINPERISMEEIHKQNGGKDTGGHTETHDGPTPSQSRSLQTFHLGDENKNEVAQTNATSVDMEGNYDNLMKHRPSTELRTGALDDFNCSYFKSDYDSKQLLGAGKTKDEKDYPDNTSQDSYQLTESRDSLDFDRVETDEHRTRGAYDGIDGKQLVKELQRQFDAREQVEHCEIDEAMQLDLMSADEGKCIADDNISYRQRMEGRGSVVAAGERRRKRLSREDAVRGLDDDSSMMGNGFVPKVQPEYDNGRRSPSLGEKAVLSEDLRGTVERNQVPPSTGNETEIRTRKSVELDTTVIEQLPRLPDQSTVQSCEALKLRSASEAAEELSDQFTEAVAPFVDQSIESSEVVKPSQTVSADGLLQTRETEEDQLKTAQTSSHDTNNVQTSEAADNQSTICQKADEEILYVLHKRHLVSTGEQTDESLLKEVRYASLPLSFCRSRSPSPGRLATKEEQKAQLEKIKATLTSMAVPPMKSPKSPGGKRVFDFVIYNRLPPKDSFSCKDDSLSPSSLEKEIMMHRRATKTVSSPETIREREPEPSRSRRTSADKEQPAEDLQKLNDIDDILANAESESDAELDAKASEAVTPEMEDEVNRVLSDIGQGSIDSDSNESSIPTEERLDDLPPPIKESETIDADFLENIPLPPPLIESVTDFELLGGTSVEADVVAINISEIPLPDGGNEASFESSLEGLLIAPPFEVIEENQTDHFDVSEIPPPLPVDEFMEAILEVEEFPPIPPPVEDFGEPLITSSEGQNIVAMPDEELPKICLSKVQHQPSSEDSLLPPPPPWLEELEDVDDSQVLLPLPEIIIRAASDVDLPSLDDSTFIPGLPGSTDVTIPVICVSASNGGSISSAGSTEEQPEKISSEGPCIRSAPLAIDPTGSPPEFTEDFKNDLQIREEKLLKKLSKDSGDVTSSSSRSLNDELDGHLPSHFSPVTDLPPAAATEAGFLLDNNLPDSELSKHGHVMEWLEEQALLNLAMIPSQDKEISDEDDVERPHAEHDLFDLYRNLETEAWGNPFLVALSRDTLPPPVPSYSSALDASSSEDADCSLMAASRPIIDSHFKHSASNHGFPDPPLSDISSEGGVVYPLKEEFQDSRHLLTAASAAESSHSVPLSVEQKVPSPLSISSEDDVERPQHGVTDLAEASSALNSASFLPGYFPVPKDSSILLDLSSESEDLPSEELPDVGDILDSNLLANPYTENLSDSDAESSPPVPCVRRDGDGIVMEQLSGLPAPVQPFFCQEKEFDISSGSSSNDLPFEYLDEPDVFAALDEIDKPFVLRPSNADSDPELHNRDEGDDADSESSSEGFMPHDDFVSRVLKHHAPRSIETDVDTILASPSSKVPAAMCENQNVAASRHEFNVSNEQSNVSEELDKDDEQSKSGSHCSGSENLNKLCESRSSAKQLVRSFKVLETEIDSSFEANSDEPLEIKPDASSKAETLGEKVERQDSDTKQSEATGDSCFGVNLEAKSCAMQVGQVEDVASRDDNTIVDLKESASVAHEVQKSRAHESFSGSCCSNAEGGLYEEAQSTIPFRETYREASSAPEDDRP